MTAASINGTTQPALAIAGAQRFGDKVAVVNEDGSTLSSVELKQAMEQAAKAFIAAGIEIGDRVALWLPNNAQWIIAALGLQMAGAALVPMSTRQKGREAAYILRRSGAKVLLTLNGFLGVKFTDLLQGQALPALEKVVILDGSCSGDEVSWLRFLQAGEAVSEEALQQRFLSLNGDTVADIMFTSGTTGSPKGVVCTHGQNIKTFANYSAVLGLQAGDRYLMVNPFFHVFGYKAGWLSALMQGATIMPHAVFDAAVILQRIDQEKVTVLPGPPTLYQTLMGLPDFSDFDLQSLRVAITGGSSVPAELIRQMKAELGFDHVLTAYGLTETSGLVSMCCAEDAPDTVATTAGKAIPGVELRIVDENLQPLASGESGELLVRGYNVMKGYFDDPVQTSKAITVEGWLHTGDEAVIDARGYVRITGRKKEMFIVGGFNCYPAEIENILLEHPAILQVAVIGVPDQRLGEVAKAFVILRSGEEISPEEIIDWSRDNMANYKVPRAVEIRKTLPTTESGKIKKFELV